MSSSVKSLAVLYLALCWGGVSAAESSPPVAGEPAGPAMHDLAAFRQAVQAGGPPKDGIPSVDRPRFVAADEVDLADEERIIGLYLDGEARAYPQRILVWHEIVNDEVAGRALSITYCPLTGTALGFNRGNTEFGVSGRLVNSNLIMYDRATDSEWPQILGVAIDGPLAGQGLEEVRLFWTTWGAWRERHSDTQVLSERTGYVRNYRRDPYGSYAPLRGYYRPESGRLFPVMHDDQRFPPKAPIFGFRAPEGAAAITPAALARDRVVNVRLGETLYTVIHDPELDTGWAYRNPDDVAIDPETLSFTPSGIEGPGIESLEPVHGFEAMWFAWVAFYPETDVIGELP